VKTHGFQAGNGPGRLKNAKLTSLQLKVKPSLPTNLQHLGGSSPLCKLRLLTVVGGRQFVFWDTV